MTDLPTSMRAVVLDEPGPPEALKVREVPVAVPEPGWVLVNVEAFGLNRSELHTRLGLADGVVFPWVLGCDDGRHSHAGVRLTAYGGDASDLPPAVLQEFLDTVAAGDTPRQ